MPRGKPFVCWLDHESRTNAIALHIGDIVDLRLDTGEWVRGKFGCSRSGALPYFVKCKGRKYQAGLRSNLRPVNQEGEVD